MRRFYFDVTICGNSIRDEEGTLLSDLIEARSVVAELLHDLALATLPDGKPQVFVATVREEEAVACLRTTLTVKSEALNPVSAG